MIPIDKDYHIEETNRLHEAQDAQTYSLSIADFPEFIKDTLSESEILTQNKKVTLWKKIDKLSTTWSNSYEVLLDGKKVWTLVKFEAAQWWESKSMFVSAQEAVKRFDYKVTSERDGKQYIPNIKAIQKYFDDYNKEHSSHREITMIVNWPTFDSYWKTTLTWVCYDNWSKVWTEESLKSKITDWRWIGYITWGKMYISHSREISKDQFQKLLNKKADIFTMSSVKRNWNLNHDSSLWWHIHCHFLVQMNDWTIWELIINNCSPKDKKQILNQLPISRALYSDADAASNYLDWMWINTDQWLRYTKPDTWDIFTDINCKEPKMIENNMPWLIIKYIEKK